MNAPVREQLGLGVGVLPDAFVAALRDVEPDVVVGAGLVFELPPGVWWIEIVTPEHFVFFNVVDLAAAGRELAHLVRRRRRA